jgi:uncharacterized protein (TIGR02611 family)
VSTDQGRATPDQLTVVRRPGRLAQHAVALRGRVRAWPGGVTIWRGLVVVVGLVLVLGGLALVPLPGPGWLIVFLGIAVWGTEFEWAARLLVWAKLKVFQGTNRIAQLPLWLRVLGGLATLGVVVAVVWAYLVWQNWI